MGVYTVCALGGGLPKTTGHIRFNQQSLPGGPLVPELENVMYRI